MIRTPQKIIACRVLSASELELSFADGFRGQIDLADALWGPVFEPLRQPKRFAEVRVEDDTIRWPNQADFCPDVLRCWCEAGRVLDQTETDACFAAQTSPATAGQV